MTTQIRLKECEKDAIQCSLVEKHLLEHMERLHEFIPGAVKSGANEFTFCGGRYKLKFNQSLSASYPGVEIQGNPFNVQLGCMPTVYESIGQSQRIINTSGLAGKFFLLRVCDIEYRVVFDSSLSYDARDIQKSRELGDWLGIKGDWTFSARSETASWSHWLPPSQILSEPFPKVMAVRSSDSTIQYHLQFFYTDFGYYVLPVSYFKNQGFGNALELFIPPPPPYALMNSEYLVIYPNAEVCLTDDIMLAKNTPPSHKVVHLCNPGGAVWIKQLDLQCLQGRKVRIALENNDEARKEGLALLEQLNSLEITNVSISIKGEDHHVATT